jgi:hypothetical protein
MELVGRDDIEASFAARVSRLTSKHRQRLVDLLGNPPDPSRVPDSFWTEAEDDMKRELAIVLLLIWGASARQHGLGVDLAEVQATRYAIERSREVGKVYAETTRSALAEKAARWRLDQGITRAQWERDIVAALGPNRAARIATTETTRAQTQGGEAGIGQTVGLSGRDLWITRRDGRVCEICEPLHRQPRSVWQLQFPTGPGDDIHPSCRCYIQYSIVPGAV